MQDFNPVLLVMKPRDLDQVVDSIHKNIDIDTFFFEMFTETEVCAAINSFINQTEYTHYIISADDIIYDKQPTEEVLNVAQNLYNEGKTEIVTGWCNLCLGCLVSNICLQPLKLSGRKPQSSDYQFIWTEELHEKYPDEKELFTTYLTSLCFSCFPKEIIEKYPMSTYQSKTGCCSDHKFSYAFYNEEQRGSFTNMNMFFTHLKKEQDHSWKEKWMKGRPRITKVK